MAVDRPPLSIDAVEPLAVKLTVSLLKATDCAFCSSQAIGATLIGAKRRAAYIAVAVCSRCQPAGTDEAEALLRRLTGRLS